MINRIVIIIFCVCTTLASCDRKRKSVETTKQTKLIISSKNRIEAKYTKIKNIATLDIEDEKIFISNHQKFVDSMLIERPILAVLLVEGQHFLFYILDHREQNISLVKDEKGRLELHFDKEDLMNQFTASFHKNLNPLFEKTLSILELDSRIISYEKRYLKKLKIIQPEINKKSYDILKSMVEGKMSHLRFIYSDNFPELKPTSSYFDFVENYVIQNDNYLIYSDNINTVLGLLKIKYERKYAKNFDDAEDKLEFINKTLKNIEIKSAILCFISSKKIPEETEEEKQEVLLKLKAFGIKEEYYQHVLNIDSGKAFGKKIGAPAKYFETLLSYDERFSMAKLRGKIVFVDNWATWCAPCIISMKEFDLKYAELSKFRDVIFVFVSFDRYESIWRTYLRERNPSRDNIFHLYNGDAMDTPYVSYYNISKFPTYFIINKKGVIIDIDSQGPLDKSFINSLSRIRSK